MLHNFKNTLKYSVKNSLKIVATLGILTVGAGSFLKNPFVDASSPVSLEISLNLNFNAGTTLESIYSKLNNQIGIDIQNITGEVFIGGKSQPISATIENDDTVGNSKGTRAMDEYQKSEDNFLNLLNKIETEGLPKSLESQREVLKPLLDEFSQKEVSETKTEALKKPSQITSISLMGSKLAVANTREKLAGVTKEATELDLVELEATAKKTQAIIAQKQEEVKNLPKEEQFKAIQATVQEEIAKTLPQEAISSPNISEEKLALVDSKLSVAPNGNVFVNAEVQKMLNSEELKSVQEHIKNYNQMPESFKDGRSQAGVVINQLSEIIQEKQISFSEIIVSANCNQVHGWGIRDGRFIFHANAWLSGCLVRNIGQAAQLVGNAITICGFTPHCSATIGILGAVLSATSGTLSWMSDSCSGNGVNIHLKVWKWPTKIAIYPWFSC